MPNPILMKIDGAGVSNDTTTKGGGNKTFQGNTEGPPGSVAGDARPQRGDYWRILRACFQNGLDPTAGTLCATLLEWAERRATEPYQFIADHLADGGAVRRGLGAIARRMAANAPEEFEAHVAADGATWSFLQPYAERNAAGMEEVDDQFGDWRGVVDVADRAAVMASDDTE